MDSKTFAYHPASEKQQFRLMSVQTALNKALRDILDHVPEGRYQQLAIDDLERAGAMAAKGIFKYDDGSARGAEE